MSRKESYNERAAKMGREMSQRVKALRETVAGPRGMTAFAKFLGIHLATYHYYENGRVLPADLAALICRKLSVSVDWLYRGKGQMFKGGKRHTLPK